VANQRFQNALNLTTQTTPPIWFMRQAGRYHQHYQALKQKHSFMELCKVPELAAEVAMGPIEDFDFDLAIMFSDLLFPLEALGMGLDYAPGPQLGWHLAPDTIANLRNIDDAVPHLEFQKEVMLATRDRLPEDKSLIGFVGGPWTLFTYAVDGAHKGHLIDSKTQIGLFNQFCNTLIPLLKKNIELQLEGGAEVVMVFDTAAGEISPIFFQHYVVGRLNELSAAFPKQLAYYGKMIQMPYLKNILGEPNWAGVGADHRWYLPDLLSTNRQQFVQGNFDETLLFSSTEEFMKRLNEFLAPMKALSKKERAGWVCGLGHGVLPKTPEKHVRLFVETVREVFS
jgi:uroporphyrinogen decarboxylase